MFGYVNASFDAGLLNQSYLDMVSGVQVLENGRFAPKEKSWLISYDANQLSWARQDLVDGTLDEAALNQGNGIVAVFSNLRHSVSSETGELARGRPGGDRFAHRPARKDGNGDPTWGSIQRLRT